MGNIDVKLQRYYLKSMLLVMVFGLASSSVLAQHNSTSTRNPVVNAKTAEALKNAVVDMLKNYNTYLNEMANTDNSDVKAKDMKKAANNCFCDPSKNYVQISSLKRGPQSKKANWYHDNLFDLRKTYNYSKVVYKLEGAIDVDLSSIGTPGKDGSYHIFATKKTRFFGYIDGNIGYSDITTKKYLIELTKHHDSFQICISSVEVIETKP